MGRDQIEVKKEHIMKVRVRKATRDDYTSVCELFDEIDALHRDNLPHLFQKPGGAAREQDYYLDLVADENVGFFVANSGGTLVGFVHAMVRDTPAIPVLLPRRHAIVDCIVVRAGFQDQGIGSRLMDRVQEWAITKGAVSIELNVYEFNRNAISFYGKLGYRTLSRKMSKELIMDQAAG
jgi:ribosomal protein S18 acetylase RimI-like enzyme